MARQKLITKAIEKALPAIDSLADTAPENHKCIVKFFTPWGANTWWVVGADKLEDGDYEFYGMVTLDGSFAEWGGFRLSDLTSIVGPFGLKVERDMYYSDSEWKRDLARFAR